MHPRPSPSDATLDRATDFAALQSRLQALVGNDIVLAARRCRPDGGRECDGGPSGDGSPILRAEQHRQGRAALGEVLAALGDPRDPWAIGFPQPRLSISHSATLAVAIGARRSDITGTGIDVEFRRPFPPGAARFFLDPAEQREPAGPGSDRLLELWTVKEAVFKADPGNRDRMLRDYRLLPPGPDDRPGHGRAARGRHRFTYRVHHLGELVVAVAHREAGPVPFPLDPPPHHRPGRDPR